MSSVADQIEAAVGTLYMEKAGEVSKNYIVSYLMKKDGLSSEQIAENMNALDSALGDLGIDANAASVEGDEYVDVVVKEVVTDVPGVSTEAASPTTEEHSETSPKKQAKRKSSPAKKPAKKRKKAPTAKKGSPTYNSLKRMATLKKIGIRDLGLGKLTRGQGINLLRSKLIEAGMDAESLSSGELDATLEKMELEEEIRVLQPEVGSDEEDEDAAVVEEKEEVTGKRSRKRASVNYASFFEAEEGEEAEEEPAESGDESIDDAGPEEWNPSDDNMSEDEDSSSDEEDEDIDEAEVSDPESEPELDSEEEDSD